MAKKKPPKSPLPVPKTDDWLAEVMSEGEPRDDSGLTQSQKAFLRARRTTLDDREAIDLVKTSRANLDHWQEEVPFRDAYAKLVPKTGIEQARWQVDSLIPSAVKALEDALDPDKVLTKTQMFAIKALMKVSGLQRIQIEHTGDAKVPIEAIIAIMELRAGKMPPPQLVDLARRHFKEADLLIKTIEGQVVEGEFKVLEE